MASGGEVLMVLMPWSPPQSYVDHVKTVSPGIEVISHPIGMYDAEVPASISAETWATVTVLLTWKTFPSRKLAPKLKYVQLSSAGCNQIEGKDLFDEGTGVRVCTASGVHP
jgi:phosphoglycerate dehydrogenase-like enzyme